MMKQMAAMQSRMEKMQGELENHQVVGTAGGGAVSVTANGQQKVIGVVIAAEAMEEGAELLADLVMAACNDALDKSRSAAAEQMAQLAQGLGLPPGLL